MYWIIGADQKEYGPVTAEELRAWIAQGRADAATMARGEAMRERRPLREFPEFADALGSVGPPPPFSPAPPPAQVYGTYPRRTTNNMAVVGMIFGILGCACCCGPLFSMPGLIFSVIGLNQIKSDPNQRGRGMAIAGIVLSILGLMFFLIALTYNVGHKWSYWRAFRL